MSIRKQFYVLKEAAGAYVAGIFVPGVRSIGTILANIQPMSNQDMVTVPEGRRIDDIVKMYSTYELQGNDSGDGLQPDLVVWRGYAYEITATAVRQMGVINHFKYIAARRMAVPSDYATAWVNGTLNRGN